MNNLKLKFLSPTFFTNNVKKKVACKMISFIEIPAGWKYKHMFFNWINEHYDQTSSPTRRSVITNDFDDIIIATRGTATLDSEDKWNERTGQMIAETKAKKKAYEIVSHMLKLFMKDLQESTQKMLDFHNKMVVCTGAEEVHVTQLSNGEFPTRKKK